MSIQFPPSYEGIMNFQVIKKEIKGTTISRVFIEEFK